MLIVRPEDYIGWRKTVDNPRFLLSIYKTVGGRLPKELAACDADRVSLVVADCRFLGGELDEALRILRAWAQARTDSVRVVAVGDPTAIFGTKHNPWLGVDVWEPGLTL